MKKIALIFIALSLFAFGSFMPNNFKNLIIEKLDIYAKTNYPEKVYVQTDKSYYLLDETVWFTGYLVNGIDHKKSDKSRVLHVELINGKDSIVDHKKLYIDKISEAGDIKISQKWSPGRYLLRAYTNDMRNNGEEYFFKKEIWIWSSEKYLESKVDHNSSGNKANELLRPGLKFYPEGGNLIEGINNKVALKMSYEDYNIEDVSGFLYDEEEHKVSNFKIYKNGLGILVFTPQKGKSYYASININGNEEHYPLPEAQPKGFTINAINNGDDILIHLSSTYESGLKGTFLVAHQRGQIVFEKFENTTNSKYSINLETDQFNDGVIHLTLFDTFGNPVSERLLFVQNPKNNINLSIEKDKKVLSTREKLSLKLNVFDAKGKRTSGDFSMAVKDGKVTTENNAAKNIKTWLLLNSDLRGEVDDPGYYFESGDELKKRFLLDLVMLTNGWRRFSWNKLLHEPDTIKKFDTELGIFITGRTLNLKSPDEPHSSATRITFVDKVPHQELQQSNENGSFKFGPYVFFDSIPTLIEARKTNFDSESQRDRRVLILLDNNEDIPQIQPSKNTVANTSEMDFNAMIGVTNYLEKLRWEYGDNVKQLDEVVVRAKRKTEFEKRNDEMDKRTIYGSPSDRIVTEDVAGAEWRNVLDLLRSKAGVRVDGSSVSIRGGGTPGFYLDGVEMDSTFIEYISGSEIAFIDILKGPEASMFSNSGNGVIAMYSKDGSSRYSNVRRSPGIIDFRAKGFYVAKEFYAPDHIKGIEEQIKPDYRTTLHWEPEIRLSKDKNMEISFFTGDLTDEYIIEIEGVTDSGIPVYTSSTFLVE